MKSFIIQTRCRRCRWYIPVSAYGYT